MYLSARGCRGADDGPDSCMDWALFRPSMRRSHECSFQTAEGGGWKGEVNEARGLDGLERGFAAPSTVLRVPMRLEVCACVRERLVPTSAISRRIASSLSVRIFVRSTSMVHECLSGAVSRLSGTHRHVATYLPSCLESRGRRVDCCSGTGGNRRLRTTPRGLAAGGIVRRAQASCRRARPLPDYAGVVRGSTP